MSVQAVPPLWADVQGDGLEDLMAGEKDIARRELVLGLDPSSTICGYAAMGSRREVVSVGWLKPGCRDDNSFERDMAMCDDLITLLEELRPTTILIEWPKGKVHEGRHHGRGAGLAVYGTGVGRLPGRQWSGRDPAAAVTWCRFWTLSGRGGFRRSRGSGQSPARCLSMPRTWGRIRVGICPMRSVYACGGWRSGRCYFPELFTHP